MRAAGQEPSRGWSGADGAQGVLRDARLVARGVRRCARRGGRGVSRACGRALRVRCAPGRCARLTDWRASGASRGVRHRFGWSGARGGVAAVPVAARGRDAAVDRTAHEGARSKRQRTDCTRSGPVYVGREPSCSDPITLVPIRSTSSRNSILTSHGLSFSAILLHLRRAMPPAGWRDGTMAHTQAHFSCRLWGLVLRAGVEARARRNDANKEPTGGCATSPRMRRRRVAGVLSTLLVMRDVASNAAVMSGDLASKRRPTCDVRQEGYSGYPLTTALAAPCSRTA